MLESMQSVEAVIVARHSSGGQAQRLVVGPLEGGAPGGGCAPAQGADQAAAEASDDGWPYPPAQDSWVMMHNALRADMLDMAAALERLAEKAAQGEPLEAWEVAGLQRYWGWFAGVVTEHQRQQDAVLFPWLASRLSVPSELEGHHATLAAAVDGCDAAMATLTPGEAGDGAAAEVAGTRDAFAAMRRRMEHHMAHEEGVLLPLMRAHFTRKEYEAVEKEMGVPLLGTPQHLAHMLRPLPLQQKVVWLTSVAGVSKLVQRLAVLPAIRQFDRQYTRVVVGVKRGDEPAQERGCAMA